MKLTHWIRALMGVALSACMAVAQAQAFPTKPVKLLVPYPAGAPVDNFARGLSEELGKLWGQNLVIDNRAGANEIVAASALVQSPADGYTLILGSDALFTQNAFLYSKLPYNADKDLVPVTRAVEFNMVLIVRADLPVKTLKDFVALMKREGEKHNYGSAGAGGTTHLAMESLKQEAGFKMNHVPYKGIAPAMQDLLGGNIDALIAGASAAMAQLPSGKVKVLAIAGKQRAKALPDVPTYAEQGYPNVVSNLYLAIAAPAGTPADVVDKLHRDLTKVLNDRKFAEKNVDPYGYAVIADTPKQFEAFLKQDKVAAGNRIKQLGVKLD
ncbi:Bug family tripartite tricarboxylate transporter substrate binding protein [Ramlibacter sp. MAHUQ-53]|uniref:Bug family tripartite tricarboxylate transporter substrate binding protein n=1 Tax=unclassified Ramlibacter TaxID=2617605 RepID=UPI00363DFAA1